MLLFYIFDNLSTTYHEHKVSQTHHSQTKCLTSVAVWLFLPPFIDICNADAANRSWILDPRIWYHCSRRGDPGPTIWILAHSSDGLDHHRTVNFVFSRVLPLVRCYTPIATARQRWRLQRLKASAGVHSSSMRSCLGLTDRAKILHTFIWEYDASFPLLVPRTFQKSLFRPP